MSVLGVFRFGVWGLIQGMCLHGLGGVPASTCGVFCKLVAQQRQQRGYVAAFAVEFVPGVCEIFLKMHTAEISIVITHTPLKCDGGELVGACNILLHYRVAFVSAHTTDSCLKVFN